MATSLSGRVQAVKLGPGCALRMARKRLGASKPRVEVSSLGSGDAGYLRVSRGGIGYVEVRGMAVDKGDGRRLPVRKFNREAQAEFGAGETELVFADFVEEAGAVAEDHRDGGDGYQTTLPKPRRPVNAVSIWSQSERRATSWGVPMASSRCADGAMAPEYVTSSWMSAPGARGCGERHRGLVELAGVVGVGVEGCHLKRNVLAEHANAFPVERGRDLERNAAEWGFAVIAHGEQGANRDLVGGRVQVDVHIKAGEVTAWRSASSAVGAETICGGLTGFA